MESLHKTVPATHRLLGLRVKIFTKGQILAPGSTVGTVPCYAGLMNIHS